MNWRARAACRGMDTELFYPDRGDMAAIAAAKAACRACPVSTECLLEACERSEPIGVWGGTTYLQRRSIRKMFGIDSYSQPEAKHGTESRYVHRGCRCEPCSQAKRVAQAQRVERRARSAA